MSISCQERRWLWRFSVAVMLLTMLPYLYAFSLTPPGMQYQWLLYNPDEPNVHLAWMRQAFDGSMLFIDPFTAEPQKATFFHALFLVLGAVARAISRTGALDAHGSLLAVYHAFRLLAGVLLLRAMYQFTAHFFRSIRLRKTALWLAVCSSGWGWLAFVMKGGPNPGDPTFFGLRPVDVSRGLMIPEGFVFPSLLLYPLFTFSMYLMLRCFLPMVRVVESLTRATTSLATETRGDSPAAVMRESRRTTRMSEVVRDLAVASGCGLLLGNIHTYDLVAAYAVLGVWIVTACIARPASALRIVGMFALFVILSCGGMVYQLINFQMNSVFREKALTLTAPRSPLEMLVSYGFVFLLAVTGIVMALRNDRRSLFLCVWMIVGALVIYAPVSFSRKMIEGLHLPMSLLAAVGLMRGVNLILKRVRWTAWQSLASTRTAVIAAAIFLMSLSNLQFLRLMGDWVSENNASRAGALMPPYYFSDDDVAAAGWLEQHTSHQDVVLCSPFLGSYLPSLSGNVVYIGHWAETLHFKEKFQQLMELLRNPTSMDRLKPSLPGVRYFLYGRYEHLLAPDFVPFTDWREVFRHGDSVVYQVRQGR